jgi:hypothetical protein
LKSSGSDKTIPAIFGNTGNFGTQRRVQGYERDRDLTVRRLQRTELLDHEEQEEYNRQDRVEQVLQALPEAHGA